MKTAAGSSARRAALACLLLTAALSVVHADVPLRVEQLIYSLSSFKGNGYSSTFALQTADTVYLLAGADNLVSVRKTLVYWWPLTAEWKTDAESLNVPLVGKLEMRGPGAAVHFLSLQRATWLGVRGADGGPGKWKVLTGPEADREVGARAVPVRCVFRRGPGFPGEVTRVRRAGAGAGSPDPVPEGQGQGRIDGDGSPPGAAAPRRPVAAGCLPHRARAGAGLVRGEPSSRAVLRAAGRAGGQGHRGLGQADGGLCSWRRTGGIGYEVIPGDKWTRPEESKTPASVLYVNGATGLYLRPFSEDEAERSVLSEDGVQPGRGKSVDVPVGPRRPGGRRHPGGCRTGTAPRSKAASSAFP